MDEDVDVASLRRHGALARFSPRTVGVALLLAAGCLAAWAAWLGGALGPGDHRWHWVGLDVVEVVGLSLTAVLLLRGRLRGAGSGAVLTAPLLWYDAALDFVSARGSATDLLVAAAMALLVEVPSSLALLWIGYHSLRPAPRR